jgi:hypothetical protein
MAVVSFVTSLLGMLLRAFVPGTLDLKEGWYALDLNPDKVTSAPVVKPKVEEDPMPSEPEAKKMLAEVR